MNKPNNNISPQFTEHTKDSDIGNAVPGLGQAQKHYHYIYSFEYCNTNNS